MKTIEQIAIETANTITAPYITDESLTRFAANVIEAWLAQQTPSSYQELADAFVLLWSSDDRAAWDKKAIEHFDTLLAKVERGSFITQQEIASHQYQTADGMWHDFVNQRHYKNTVEDGSWPIRALYTAPPTAPEGFENAINEAVKAEREACARVADDWQLDDDCETYLCSCATAIRERVEKK